LSVNLCFNGPGSSLATPHFLYGNYGRKIKQWRPHQRFRTKIMKTDDDELVAKVELMHDALSP
jgi:hypothetical protein